MSRCKRAGVLGLRSDRGGNGDVVKYEGGWWCHGVVGDLCDVGQNFVLKKVDPRIFYTQKGGAEHAGAI